MGAGETLYTVAVTAQPEEPNATGSKLLLIKGSFFFIYVLKLAKDVNK